MAEKRLESRSRYVKNKINYLGDSYGIQDNASVALSLMMAWCSITWLIQTTYLLSKQIQNTECN